MVRCIDCLLRAGACSLGWEGEVVRATDYGHVCLEVLLLILKFWIFSFVKMPEAVAPVGGGPTLGVMGVGLDQRGQPGILL